MTSFGHSSWRDRQFEQPHHYWLPVFGVLTGMRLNEVCQLRPRDFIKVGDVDCIECANLTEGARGKNVVATRTFPVHKLIRLWLLRYVEFLRQHKHTQLFPELVEGRDGFGAGSSKWFGRYCDAVGVTEKCYVFHSFRHLFISQRLNQLQLPKHAVQAIVGHEQEDVTTDVYWEGAFDALKDVVDADGFPPEVAPLVPVYEDVHFTKARRVPPSRLGARKSREKRIADAAIRRSKNGEST